MTPLQIARNEQQRVALVRREGERRRVALDHALAADHNDRRETDRRAEQARRLDDRVQAARFNHALARWHNAKERNAA